MATEIKSATEHAELAEGLNQVREQVKSLLERGAERAHHLQDAAMERGRHAIGTMRHTVEERPYAVIGAAFACGVILGMWLRR